MTFGEKKQLGWREALLSFAHPPVAGMIFLGFSSGLPFLLVFSTLSAWLRDAGVTRAAIGFFSLVGIIYSFKFVWAPVVDKVPLPLLTRLMGKRRSWMLAAQLGIVAGLIGMALGDIDSQIHWLAVLALFVSFCSATQDITIDAYRIEAVTPEYQGAMAATYVFGYRLALLVAGAGAFYIAEYVNWRASYLVMAGLMPVGIIATFCTREPAHKISKAAAEVEKSVELFLGVRSRKAGLAKRLSRFFSDAVISPFVEFFVRNGKFALVILLLIGVYKLSDIAMGVMANPFYLDLGYTLTEIANVTKIFGFFMTILGAALGGALVVRYGLMKPLFLGAVLAASTNLLFAMLATAEPDLALLAVVVSADNLSGGLATSVFVAYLSSLTNSAYTATQYALFSSLMTLPGKTLGAFSGVIVDGQGYFVFFVYSALIGLPAILLVAYVVSAQKNSVPVKAQV